MGRVIDAFVTIILAAVAAIAVLIPLILILLAVVLRDGFTSDIGVFVALLTYLLVGVAVLVVVVRYEVVKTARTGQTLGKEMMGLMVISESGQRPVFWARWALPHGVGLGVGQAGAIVGYVAFGDDIRFVGLGAGAGLVGWVLVYASALWDKDRRGWHDKIARTIVVEVASLDSTSDQQPTS